MNFIRIANVLSVVLNFGVVFPILSVLVRNIVFAENRSENYSEFVKDFYSDFFELLSSMPIEILIIGFIFPLVVGQFLSLFVLRILAKYITYTSPKE